ncbi:MAG: TlpA disulfide reductase family protein [Mesorhizobium sp.]
MSDGKKIFPGFAPVALAVVAGLVAGAVAVYVSGGMSGNMEPVAAAPSAPAAPAVAASTCTAKEARARSVAAAATGEVAAMMATDPPQPAPTLAFDGPDGAQTDFGSMSGKVLLVNLWATWCAPCRAEMPALDELQRKLGSADFEVVAMNVDTGDDEKPKKFLEETEIRSLPWYRENSLALFNDLKRRSLALGLPVTLLVDRDGCIIANMNGPAEWASDDAERLIKAALAP